MGWKGGADVGWGGWGHSGMVGPMGWKEGADVGMGLGADTEGSHGIEGGGLMLGEGVLGGHRGWWGPWDGGWGLIVRGPTGGGAPAPS